MYYDPFENWTRIHDNMEKLFNQMLLGEPRNLLESKANEHNKNLSKLQRGFRLPVGDVMETETKVIGKFEIPGVKKEDITLNIKDSNLEIKANTIQDKEENTEKGYRYFKTSSKFYRSVPLPAEIDINKSKAKFENGVLEIEMEKLKETQTKNNHINIE